MKVFPPLSLLFIGFFAYSCLAQGSGVLLPADKWISEYGIWPESSIAYRYDRYSKGDISNFRKKIELLNEMKDNDEWEGIYSTDFPDQVGISQLRLNKGAGFVDFYVYSCMPELRGISYGTIQETADNVILTPQYADDSPRKEKAVIYVKVKWTDRNYLVEESSLRAFLEKSVGVYVEKDDPTSGNYQTWSRYWVKGDLEKTLTGLPVVPFRYKRLVRSPIKTKIVAVGKRFVESDKTLGNVTYSESAFYPVTISSGEGAGVKVGMRFRIPSLYKEIFITKVNESTASGLIVREIDENKNDQCFSDDLKSISCPEVNVGIPAQTYIGNFWW